MSDSGVHVFGIRHHGPGSARSLSAALESLAPDVVLIEGPSDADDDVIAVAEYIHSVAAAGRTQGAPPPNEAPPPDPIVGDASADGTRFLLVTPVGPSASVPFTVVLNWTMALKK